MPYVFNACVVQTIGGSMKKAVGYTRAFGRKQKDMESSPDKQATLLRNAANRNNTQLVGVAEEGQSVSKERKGRGRQRRS
jgi:hypothetical protein